MAAVKRGPVTTFMWKTHRWIYRVSGGRIGSKVLGMGVLGLTTTGRKSGQPRQVLLSYLDHGDAYAVVASNAGHHSHPAWFLNLEANPGATVQVRQDRFPARARRATGTERQQLWDRFVEAERGYAEYATRTDREIPIVVLDRVG